MTRADRGPCDQCEHVRQGGSIARAVFDVVLDVYKPSVKSAYTRKMQEEVQGIGEFEMEIEGIRELGYDTWSRRPSAPQFRYCGVAEFEDIYYCCEIKNQYDSCKQFSRRGVDRPPRACATCEHHQPPSSRPVVVLGEFLAKETRDRNVNPALEAHAESEYQDCVDGVGILQVRPRLLPVCEARSPTGAAAGRYLVGPVVNPAANCDRWSVRTRTESERTDVRLDVLLTRAAQVKDQRFATLTLDQSGYDAKMRAALANAQADVVEYCLRSLGAPADAVAAICTNFTSDLWASHWDGPRFAGGEPPAAIAATQQASAPFRLEPRIWYSHPVHLGVLMTLVAFRVLEVRVGRSSLKYDLKLFKGSGWTQLRNAEGPLPITVHVQAEPPGAVHAAWY